MTAQECYEKALALNGTNTSEDNSLEEYIVGWVNLALYEMFGINNSLRAFRGLDELSAVPQISTLTDALTYEDDVVSTAIVYRLAAQVAKEDNDTYHEQYFENMSQISISTCKKCRPGIIEDVYQNE